MCWENINSSQLVHSDKVFHHTSYSLVMSGISSHPDGNDLNYSNSYITNTGDNGDSKQAASTSTEQSGEEKPEVQDNNLQRDESASATSGRRKRQRRQHWIDTAFRETTELLEELPSDGARFLAPMPSVVSLRNAVKDTPALPLKFAPRINSNITASATNSTTNDGSGNNNTSTMNDEGVSNDDDHIEGESENHYNERHNPGDGDSASHRDQQLRGIYQQSNISVINQHRRGQQHNDNDGSLLTPNRGHHALFRGLEELQDFEMLESELKLKSSLTTSLTTIATSDDERCESPRDAVDTLEALSRSVPRRVCQHPFKKNDIVWVCRTCQADETCVLCHACYKGSNHEGHDVAFYHAQAGGCCDCGDPDAWDPAGFCDKHGPAANIGNSYSSGDGTDNDDEVQNLGPLSGSVIFRVQGIVPAAVDWMVKYVAKAAKEGFARTEEEEQRHYTRAVEMKNSVDVITAPTTTEAAATSSRGSDFRLIFSPSAAGSSRRQQKELPYSKAEKLGMLAKRGGGLYLVLKSDDIHTDRQLVEAFRDLFGTSSLYTESILQKVVQALKQFGQLVVWGTAELIAELSPTQIRLWLDGDRITSGIFGSAILRRAKILTGHGLFCSILTRQELQIEQHAVIVLQWLTALARSCDPLCQKVAESISPDRHLAPLLRADFKLSSRVTKYWHSLLLTLLAVPAFKSHLAVAYCDTYQSVTAEYARGMGVLERSGYALSVQFLNRVTYVVDLVQRRDLLGKLGASLYQTLDVAALPVDDNDDDEISSEAIGPGTVIGQRQRRLNPNHFVMMNRRYSPCISDLKCVLNVKGMPRLFATKTGCFLKDWIAALGLGQMMDSQVWRDWTQGHVEVEHRGWVGAFNASISLGSLFERLLSWDDSDPSPIQDPQSPMSKNLMSCVELAVHVLVTGVHEWQTLASSSYKPTSYTTSSEPYKRRSASLPFSTISVKRGSVLAFRALPVSQVTPFSFHLPLHRFVAACLREACLRETGIRDLRSLLSQSLSNAVQDNLFIGLMEFPLLVLSRAAQVRVGLWRRNGNGLNDQVLNYAEPPFCRAMRDADLLLIQFAMIGRTENQTTDCRPDSDVGVCFLIHLLLHRLGLFDFCGLAKAPNADVNRYLDEVQKGLYSSENNSEEMGDDFLMPLTYSPARDTGSCLLLLEEFLHAMIIICKELPPLPPPDKSAHTSQAKWRLRREVVHRLASGPKTHSEMAEVHHVLSHWDNVYLSEEGKLVNPDDATSAALGAVLADVANRKISHRKMEPDKWELNREAWEDYDPSFYHINLRNHQTAAESRPAFPADNKFRVKPKPFCPPLFESHCDFIRLRRDVTCDATILAITYRTLHMHIRDNKKTKDAVDLRGAMAYEGDDKSETAVARAVHLLTLGAYAWQDAFNGSNDWRQNGGGSIGSIFFDRSDNISTPTAKEWISAALLTNPRIQQASEWYDGEENCLQLLRRLAVDGGYDGCFFAQDRAVQAGAAWLCEFAAKYNSEASKLVYLEEVTDCVDTDEKQEKEIERRSRVAKEKAIERMKAQAAKFAIAMQEELGDNDEKESSEKDEMANNAISSVSRQDSFASGLSNQSLSDSDKATSVASFDAIQAASGESQIPMRLLKCRPRCIICSDDSNAEKRPKEREELGHRHSRRRRNNGGNALAFVGYTQASTVMKGGGGTFSGRNNSSDFTPVRRFVGAHVALCGHAIHSECWESYLASVSRLEDRRVSKKDEFRCPLCQRLSNCLIPFIDVGLDWIDPASSKTSSIKMEITKLKSDDGTATMSCEDSSMEETGPSSLQEFLASTPWWVSKHNDSLIWDGQCAFVSKTLGQEARSDKIEYKGDSVITPRRRSVRALRKKDLYAAWNAMMKTPRFVRRKLRSKSEGKAIDMTATGRRDDHSIVPLLSTDSAAETVVWRRFMDQVSDITYKADGKRLGDENLHNDFGEFRHYIVEKYSYNMANRYANKEPLDWPSCVFPTTLYDTQRQELSREKLLSKLMMSIQSLTYSVCCEANEARRLIKKAKIIASKHARSSSSSSGSINSIFSKYGISEILCNGKMIIMPQPNATEDDGFQPFNGRLGRLRYFGLAVMATAGAVAADLVQLVINFPLQSPSNVAKEPYRAPVVYPLLLGNVLTHVVAAICASGGRARARSDSLELVWPIPFSSKGSFIYSDCFRSQKNGDSVVNDSEGFIKLGLLATVLQVLLGKIDIIGIGAECKVLETLQQMIADSTGHNSVERIWTTNCLSLLEMALSKERQPDQISDVPNFDVTIAKRIKEGCFLAAKAACSFLADIGIILQLLAPSIMTRYMMSDNYDDELGDDDTLFTTLNKLRALFQLESISEILDSGETRQVLSNWYETARNHIKATSLPGATISRSGASVASRLFQTQGFRVYDWPMELCYQHNQQKLKDIDIITLQEVINGTPMEIDSPVHSGVLSTSPTARPQVPPPLVTFSSKKNVKLIGGYISEENATENKGRPRVTMIPTSYTDLYAELSQLLPESDQTSVCLVCGEVLNAGGKGECTKHSFKCGAGTGMFFLLQECAGLIMHNGKAAYIHSPYVDSHGETPQYRGRPLNLDLDRYDHLREVWSGHSIRQQVLAERESSRQIIVDGFY